MSTQPPSVEAPPFIEFAQQLRPQSVLRAAITAAYRRPEPECVAMLLEAARLPAEQAQAAHALATDLARKLRDRKTGVGREGLVQGLIQEFSLSSQEGVALMCLAEALLRIPDAGTRDALIRDKIGEGNWQSHLGQSGSVFVNAATWGLLLTGRIVATHNESGLSRALTRIVAKSGEPLIRKGVDMAMRLMGEQFVTGETIAQALANARRREAEGFRYSYDMLGEAALTDADAQRYLAAYEAAIHAIGQASAGRGIYDGPGISIKLSALHPRYSRAQIERALGELYPRLLKLALLAQRYDIGLNIDAEEADRLEISLDLLEKLCDEPALQGWNGIGFVVQGYQKRCPYVLDHLIELARRTRRRLMVRLVKGAYWDSEIKRAQVDGLEGYPVYTRKAYTDVSYLACARKLLAAPEAVYPQFATHNAHTLAAIYQAAGKNYYAGQYEFQCLHGMGEPLYEQVVGPKSQGGLARPCRIYAPVGTHETLLAYLVRRLLENGANTSFVNRIADDTLSIDELVADPVLTVEGMAALDGSLGAPHAAIGLPRELFGDVRPNSSGIDLSNEHRLSSLASALLQSASEAWQAAPWVAGSPRLSGPAQALRNPAHLTDVVGEVFEATQTDVADALAAAEAGLPAWRATAPADRAAMLEHAADAMEAQMQSLIGLIVREAGKTCANAIGEVREAVDFLRYYAEQARRELSTDVHLPLGIVVCISPWNFPLAIFTGQIAAALAAGNVVLAKPAEQTPLIATQAVKLLLAAGIPGGALQLLPGRGETVGAALAADTRIRGVMFTGSTDVARILQRALAGRLDDHGRPLVLIAETGGQNAMIVDSSALAEQVVQDVLTSAFDSAGQRCSALRVLCVQDDVADRVTEMLQGALQELRIGRPDRLATDVGPVIDDEARQGIEAHISAMRAQGRRVHQLGAGNDAATIARGSFVVPTVIEIADLAELKREVFGPVLHVLRYEREKLGELVAQINATGYGLTLGIHTRIDETIDAVVASAHVGNQYVNRNIVGAVVGVQPFGGDGLSGTGPKAGGPLYLRRLLADAPQGFDGLGTPEADDAALRTQHLKALKDWRDALAAKPAMSALRACCDELLAASPVGLSVLLPGPTGERNTYTLRPREAVLCVAADRIDLLHALGFVLAADARAVWFDDEEARAALAELPAPLRRRVKLVADAMAVPLDAALIHGDAAAVAALSVSLARRGGAIVSLQAAPAGARGGRTFVIERLLAERSVSVNTAAAGGNASLMTIG
jgi:RHH-type transcriptional regulator, proline utilization regulon repressor / proline dehydrogenase / delta 1-pyrroline-5-carboxylate dehydrogenase